MNLDVNDIRWVKILTSFAFLRIENRYVFYNTSAFKCYVDSLVTHSRLRHLCKTLAPEFV